MAKSTCNVDDCDRPAETRGMCGMHYKRARRGAPLQAPPLNEAPEIRFWRKVDRRGSSECWPWLADKHGPGYGKFKVGGRRVLAHRFAYELVVGPIPEGFEIDHVRARGCIQTDCVNPAHLEAVTPRVNNHRSTSPAAVNAAKTQCPRGHAYDRFYVWPNGRRGRVCSTCQLEAQRRYYARVRARRAS
jgi:hypothetical protein